MFDTAVAFSRYFPILRSAFRSYRCILVCHPVPRIGDACLFATFGINSLARLRMMVLAQASVGTLDGEQLELSIWPEIDEKLQCLVRVTRLELDGRSIIHLLKTQVRVGNSKSMSILAVRSGDKCSIATIPLFAIVELEFAILFAFAINTSHAPPLLVGLLLPKISIFPVEF